MSDRIDNIEVRGDVLRVVVLPATGHYSTLRVLLAAAIEVCDKAQADADWQISSEFARIQGVVEGALARIS